MNLPSSRPDEEVVNQFTVAIHYTIAQVLFAALLPFLFYWLFLFLVRIQLIQGDLASVLGTVFVWAGALVGLYIILSAIYLRLARHYFVTNERILQVTGWLAQQTVSIDYTTITDITVEQDIIERFLLKTGTLMIDTAGQPTEEINLHHIATPAQLRDQILGQVEACRLRNGQPQRNPATTTVTNPPVSQPVQPPPAPPAPPAAGTNA